MAMDEADRARLGAQIRQRREAAFGTKKAAYTKADVNSATWDKAESGDVVRGDLMRKIVRSLWPDTDGDWSRIDSVTPVPQDASYVAAPGALHAGPMDDVLTMLRAMKADIAAMNDKMQGIANDVDELKRERP